MDKSKQGPQTVKNVKPEGDGLSKKERRALKVQEKQKQGAPSTKSVSTEQSQSKVNDVNKIEKPSSNSQLSEKELRKLEWEKKLAEQKKAASAEDDALSKAELRKKRREQQEAQRLAKEAAKQKEQKPTKEAKKQESVIAKEASPAKQVVKKTETKKALADHSKLQLVSHLDVSHNLKKLQYERAIVNYKNVHAVFVKLGVQYATKKILGSNARCLALLTAIKYLIEDLQTPPKQEFCRYLENVLESCVNYLQYCRPFAVSMSNALKYFKVNLHKATSLPDNEKKKFLIDHLITYISDEIGKAGEAISMKVNEKISNKDVILTYGCSSLIKKILLDAHKAGKQFEVIVADGRPFLEGRQLLQRLVQAGIHCTYIQINALSYVMATVTKVLLGAHALLTNGYVMSRIGTAQVALVARAYNKPVLVCCETYKFSERVQTDSLVYNELGDSTLWSEIHTVEETNPLIQARNDPNLSMINLLYDVTPPDLVTAVVTELAILPCTSVPVVLRIKPSEFN